MVAQLVEALRYKPEGNGFDTTKSTGYPLHSSVSPSLPPPVRHHVPSCFNWTRQAYRVYFTSTVRYQRGCRIHPLFVLLSGFFYIYAIGCIGSCL